MKSVYIMLTSSFRNFQTIWSYVGDFFVLSLHCSEHCFNMLNRFFILKSFFSFAHCAMKNNRSFDFKQEWQTLFEKYNFFLNFSSFCPRWMYSFRIYLLMMVRMEVDGLTFQTIIKSSILISAKVSASTLTTLFCVMRFHKFLFLWIRFFLLKFMTFE